MEKSTTPPVPIRVLDCVYDEDTNFIVASILFLENKIKRRFCWPSGDLIQAFNIRGNVEPHHWKKFCSDLRGKEIKIVCEMVGDPEAPAATYAQMQSVQEKLIERYFPEEMNGG